MFAKINSILEAIDGFVWGLPLIILILVTGIFLTIRLKGVQFKQLKFALKSIFSKNTDGGDGELSSFKALCTALSATVGTGNIVGVATAIALGGPGALFWMWLAALLGMATKYAECLLAIHYREEKADGHILGGPFYTCEKGVGAKFPVFGKLLAVLFAIFGTMVGLFGIGTFSQVNSITNGIQTFAKTACGELQLVNIPLLGSYSVVVVVSSIILAVFVALVIIGGLKRISTVAGVIVPVMAVIYVVFAVFALACNVSHILDAIEAVFQGAFGFKAATGGAVGAMIVAMQKGIARGIFSNEAGLGSAPIAASAAKVDHAVQQGIISMTGTFFDTIVICSMTGLSIVIGLLIKPEIANLTGFELTNSAFQVLLPRVPPVVISFVLMISLVLFAFTTILGWDYYSERCIEYLSNGNMTPVKIYRWLYIVAVFAGPYMTVSAVWTIADIVNGLMAIPNIISLLILNGVIVKLTKDFFSGKRIYTIGYDFNNDKVLAD
ncbi:MAG: sodium:alanine symporter family protein [Treponema sp.]|nr:sodium:alanine symporter family protein [Treponema sp.]